MEDDRNYCSWTVTRGGFSSGGGYDRMNFTRRDTCYKPIKTSGSLYCNRCIPKAKKFYLDTLRKGINRIRRDYGFDHAEWNARVAEWEALIEKAQREVNS